MVLDSEFRLVPFELNGPKLVADHRSISDFGGSNRLGSSQLW